MTPWQTGAIFAVCERAIHGKGGGYPGAADARRGCWGQQRIAARLAARLQLTGSRHVQYMLLIFRKQSISRLTGQAGMPGM
jgi:hypothetical protein